MGACDFGVRAKGKTAKEAFNNAVEEAQYESGHGGYTGTIAEKHAFNLMAEPDQFFERPEVRRFPGQLRPQNDVSERFLH